LLKPPAQSKELKEVWPEKIFLFRTDIEIFTPSWDVTT